MMATAATSDVGQQCSLVSGVYGPVVPPVRMYLFHNIKVLELAAWILCSCYQRSVLLVAPAMSWETRDRALAPVAQLLLTL